MRGLPYEVKSLIQKSRESALLAIETYNRPTASFRSGAYIVLMNIAWTALFHAIFLRHRTKPFYRKPNSRRYVKVDGEPKRWELKECLAQFCKEDNPAWRKNLEFFIGLRNKIEHCTLAQVDPEIFGECQAMLLNFESQLVAEFGSTNALHAGLSFALQFARTPAPSPSTTGRAQQRTFKAVKQYVDTFRSSLDTQVKSALEYSFKVYLVPKISNNPGEDTVAVEWVKYDPNKPEEMKQYERVVAMIKPKEVRVANLGMLKAKQVTAQVSKRLGKAFTLYEHKLCYQYFNARPPRSAPDPSACDLRYCLYDEVHQDYSYTAAWVEFLSKKLEDVATYEIVIVKGKAAARTGVDVDPPGEKNTT